MGGGEKPDGDMVRMGGGRGCAGGDVGSGGGGVTLVMITWDGCCA